MKKVLVEMTVEQAEASCRALDFLARMSMGQINVLDELCRFERLKARDAATGRGRDLTLEELSRIGELCSSIKRVLGFNDGGAFSVGDPAVSTDAHRAYEVLCVMREALAKDKTPDGNSVWHYGLRLRYTDDPAPNASIVHAEVG